LSWEKLRYGEVMAERSVSLPGFLIGRALRERWLLGMEAMGAAAEIG
jgi:hypothetical protein